MADKAGRQAVVINSIRDLTGTWAYQSTGSSATMISSISGYFLDIVELVLTNESSTATIVSISDAVAEFYLTNEVSA